MSVFTAPEQMCQPKSMNFVRKMYVGTRIPSEKLMKTEIFSSNELNVDGNGDYVQIVIQVTGSDFDYSSILDYIRALKRKTEYADTDYLVDETCEWLRSKGNVCTHIPFCVVEF